MKTLLAVLLFGLLFVHPASGQRKTDIEWGGFKGRVKSVRVEQHDIVQRDPTVRPTKRFLDYVTNYDEKGYVIETLKYNYDGSLHRRSVFARDGEGNQIYTVYKADGTIDSKWINRFDARSKKIASEWYSPDGTLHRKTVSTYDDKGRLIKETTSQADGPLIYETLWTYDDQAKQGQSVSYRKSGTLMSKTVWSKTSRTVLLFDEDEVITWKVVYQPPSVEYDSHGNWIKQSTPKTVTQGPFTTDYIQVIYRIISYY